MNLEILADTVGAAPEEQPPPPPVARRLSELERPTIDDPDELLRDRFLCCGGGALIAGPTGIGKSSLCMQLMILWALMLEAFGIKPKRPLKSLLIQAENDDGDLAEMRDGVIRGLRLSAEDAERATANIIVARENVRTGVGFTANALRPLLEAHRPDLVWIDPALAYLGGDSNSQSEVGGFLRNLINPLLSEFKCGCFLVHHTNKPSSGREKADWQGGDFAYLGGGSAEWANWPRAVLALRSLGSHSVFELCAAKRGSRLRWREKDGVTQSFVKYIAHAEEPQGVICWREADASEVSETTKGKRKHTKDDVLAHVPMDGAIAKDELRAKANSAGIGVNRVNDWIAELIQDGVLHESRVTRPGTSPKKLLSRFPQPKEEVKP